MSYIIWFFYMGGVTQNWRESEDKGSSKFLRLVDAVCWPWQVGEWAVRKTSPHVSRDYMDKFAEAMAESDRILVPEWANTWAKFNQWCKSCDKG